MTNEDIEEWYQDMREEAYEDERDEYLARTDYDYFCDKYLEEIAEFNELYVLLKRAHEQYDWEFNIRDILY